jgi:hypothetical protein
MEMPGQGRESTLGGALGMEWLGPGNEPRLREGQPSCSLCPGPGPIHKHAPPGSGSLATPGQGRAVPRSAVADPLPGAGERFKTLCTTACTGASASPSQALATMPCLLTRTPRAMVE